MLISDMSPKGNDNECNGFVQHCPATEMPLQYLSPADRHDTSGRWTSEESDKAPPPPSLSAQLQASPHRPPLPLLPLSNGSSYQMTGMHILKNIIYCSMLCSVRTHPPWVHVKLKGRACVCVCVRVVPQKRRWNGREHTKHAMSALHMPVLGRGTRLALKSGGDSGAPG